jgi:hypothetical protein
MQNTYYSELPIPVQGVHAELSDVDLAPTMLSDAENFVYRDGRLRVREGLTDFATTTSARVTGFAQWKDEADNVLVMTTTAKYFVWNNTTQAWTDLSGSLSGDETTHNVFRIFQQGSASGTVTTMYGQNGVNDMKQYVYGDASVANVTVATVQPPRAKAMMVLADRMLLGNITDATDAADYTGAIGPQVVCVSNSQDPTQGYSSVLVAQLQDTPGEIVAMQEMGNLNGAIYKDDAIYMAVAQSDAVPFAFQLAQKVPGPVSPRAVVVIHEGLHYYLATTGDVMSFDGNTAQPVSRSIQRYVQSHWNSNQINRAHGWYDHERDEVVFVFPDLIYGDCTRGIVLKLSSGEEPTLWPLRFTQKITGGIRCLLPGGVTIGSLSATTIGTLTLPLGDYDSLGTALVLGTSTGLTYTNDGTTDDGIAIPAFIQYGLNPLNNPRTWKSPKFVDMVFKETGSQDVTVSVTGTAHGVQSAVSSATIDIGDDETHRTYHRGSSRRLALKLEASATEEIELQAAYISYAEQGPR